MKGSFKINDYTLYNKLNVFHGPRKSVSPEKSPSPSPESRSPVHKVLQQVDSVSFELFQEQLRNNQLDESTQNLLNNMRTSDNKSIMKGRALFQSVED